MCCVVSLLDFGVLKKCMCVVCDLLCAVVWVGLLVCAWEFNVFVRVVCDLTCAAVWCVLFVLVCV